MVDKIERAKVKLPVNDVTKLPKWAQDHIEHLVRERDAAQNRLNEYIDSKTKSMIWVDDCYPSRKRYIQSRTVVICTAVMLEVQIKDDDIRLQWSGPDRDIASNRLDWSLRRTCDERCV